MANCGLTAEQALAGMGVPEEERARYVELLCQDEDMMAGTVSQCGGPSES